MAGKSRSLKFIAWIDSCHEDDCEYEGVFLQKVDSEIGSGMGDKGQTFAESSVFILEAFRLTLFKRIRQK